MADELLPVAGTWSDVMGIRILHADAAEVRAELDVERKHLQAFGLVHGGVYSRNDRDDRLAWRVPGRACERACRRRARRTRPASCALCVAADCMAARPRCVGRTTQLWEAVVRDDDDHIVASGRVRLLCKDP